MASNLRPDHKSVSFQLHKDDVKWLDDLAKTKGLDRSKLFRILIKYVRAVSDEEAARAADAS